MASKLPPLCLAQFYSVKIPRSPEDETEELGGKEMVTHNQRIQYGKWKNSHLTVQKPGKHDLNLMIKDNSTRGKSDYYHIPLIGCDRHFTSAGFFLKTHNLILIMRKY